MTGSTRFSLEGSENFQRSFKKLGKLNGDGFKLLIGDCLEKLLADPYPSASRLEPLPKTANLPEGWTFHKLEQRIGKGASGQIRLMYLVNEELAVIKPIWIYSHEQFVKRPNDKSINDAIKEIFSED